jgi:hypothetical protein
LRRQAPSGSKPVFEFPPRRRSHAATDKARDCFARGNQNLSVALTLGNVGVEGATDLARENLSLP